MIRRFSALLFAVVLAVVFTTISRAQDSTKEMPKQEGKAEMMKAGKDMGKGEKEMGPLYSVTCDPACGFMVRSHDQKELTSIVMRHAKTMHNKKVTDKDVKGMMKAEEAAAPKE